MDILRYGKMNGVMSLSENDIKERMTELRNLRMLHGRARERVVTLEKENREMKVKYEARIAVLEATVETQRQIINDFKLQLEELRTMVFGKKKKKDDDDVLPPKEKVERTSDSYRRPIPKDEDVTETTPHPLNACAHCHVVCSEKKVVTFFEEDIPLPSQKTVTKHMVEKVYCKGCRKWSTPIPLPYHKVILGNNIQKYICYLSVMCRLSYRQIQDLLLDSYHIEVSQGEIAKILERIALKHRPEYEQLKLRIRGEPGVGLDETSWKILIGGDTTYGWVMTGIESKESIYLLGESRGGGNVNTLLGLNYNGFVITDDYNAYQCLSKHQLCWAHLIRKFRDMAQSKELCEELHIYWVEQYKMVAEIFFDIEQHRDEDQRNIYTKRLEQLATITSKDCKKMIRIKTTLLKNIPLYLTCLGNPLIPLTNNQSERSLRHLVLKRKISFGSLCKRTAENLAILLSVLMSRKVKNPQTYFTDWVEV